MAILQGNAKQGSTRGFYPRVINGSLRFNDNDSAYLSKNMSTVTGAWTLSMWIKRTGIGKSYDPIGSFRADEYRFENDALKIEGTFTSSMLFRDPSAWYHLVFSDSGSDQTVYVNGESIGTTGFTRDFGDSGTVIGRMGYNSTHFDGYLAEVHFTDGTAYDADAFGELKENVWVAKAPSVDYGTNGFYLDFANSADIGNDVSGEGNDWTPNNFTASDVVSDSPTNNFCTMNPINPEGDAPLSDGNLLVGSTTDNYSLGTMLIPSSGKWYFEANTEVLGSTVGIGIQKAQGLVNDGGLQDVDNLVYTNISRLYGAANGTYISYGSSFGVDDVIGVAINMDDGELTFYNENSTQGTKNATDLSIDIRDYEWVVKIGSYNVSNRIRVNFGQDSTFGGRITAGNNTDGNGIGDFKYTPPSGFLALCTANLPDPAIDPAQGSSPEDYFNTVLYTGDGTSSRAITGVGFQPDFLWYKTRNQTYDHKLFDVVRTPSNRLSSNSTSAEVSFGELSSFDSDGFTLVDGSASKGNGSGESMVAWNWKANGSGVSNTDGSITSTVSANTESGFSIVSYTCPATTVTGDTIGHGLEVAPEFAIFRNRDFATDWGVYHKDLGNTHGILLNSTDASFSSTEWWNNTSPTNTVMSLGRFSYIQRNSDNYIAYFFHSVDGFSKFGSYTGNGSADGTFVYTGFRPAFILIKSSTVSGSAWYLFDEERNIYNPLTYDLYANYTNAESGSSSGRLDMLSNGFKMRSTSADTNSNGATMIYMAFAENPFKYSNAR